MTDKDVRFAVLALVIAAVALIAQGLTFYLTLWSL